MKILLRLFSLTLLYVLMSVFFILSISQTTRYDELNSILTSAMTTTQMAVQENIEDRLNATSFASIKIENNEDYLKDFKRNLDKLKSTDTVYDIYVYGVDYEKGLLDIEIQAKMPIWKGGKTITVRKTSIVERRV